MSRHVDDGGSVAAPLHLYPEDLYPVGLRFAADQDGLDSGDSITAMADFWSRIWKDDADGGKAPLSTAKYACDQLVKACDAFAQAIDTAHSKVEHKLGEAGIAIGFTTAVGAALSLFTFGGSDAAAGALDAGEAAAILGEVEVTRKPSLLPRQERGFLHAQHQQEATPRGIAHDGHPVVSQRAAGRGE